MGADQSSCGCKQDPNQPETSIASPSDLVAARKRQSVKIVEYDRESDSRSDIKLKKEGLEYSTEASKSRIK